MALKNNNKRTFTLFIVSKKRTFMTPDNTFKIENQLKLIIDLIQQLNSYKKSFPILTQKELLEQLKISPNTLKSWESLGLTRLEPPIENTRTVFYKIEDVISFLSN